MRRIKLSLKSHCRSKMELSTLARDFMPSRYLACLAFNIVELGQ